ncbi:hypothetical protein B0H13DRAFT_1875446 [Mycena leptocephala]|nr:hypothetical protein B0H13DRAFT_1875446 [Mycena leptocephala]
MTRTRISKYQPESMAESDAWDNPIHPFWDTKPYRDVKSNGQGMNSIHLPDALSSHVHSYRSNHSHSQHGRPLVILEARYLRGSLSASLHSFAMQTFLPFILCALSEARLLQYPTRVEDVAGNPNQGQPADRYPPRAAATADLLAHRTFTDDSAISLMTPLPLLPSAITTGVRTFDAEPNAEKERSSRPVLPYPCDYHYISGNPNFLDVHGTIRLDGIQTHLCVSRSPGACPDHRVGYYYHHLPSPSPSAQGVQGRRREGRRSNLQAELAASETLRDVSRDGKDSLGGNSTSQLVLSEKNPAQFHHGGSYNVSRPNDIFMVSPRNGQTLSRIPTLASSDWPGTPLPPYARPLPKIPSM